jgi:hypothetical protein
MTRFWILYYWIFGPKYTRRALMLMVAMLGFFFYCFVHEAFDSTRPANVVRLVYRSRPLKAALLRAEPRSVYNANRD